MKPATLTPEEEAAIVWHADQQVEAALQANIITEDARDAHWHQVAGDLLDDPELLAKMAAAHRVGERDSSRVLLDHYDMLNPKAVTEEPLPEVPHKGNGRNGLAVAGAVLSLATPGNMMLMQNAVTVPPAIRMPTPHDPRRETPELPPRDDKPKVVTERRPWVDRHRRRRGQEPELNS